MLARFEQRPGSQTQKEVSAKRGSIRTKAVTSRQLAKTAARFAEDKKAQNVVVLDMRKLVNFCDYFVICSADSDRQVAAIVKGVEEALSDLGLRVRHKQGMDFSTWALLDLGDIVVHVFEGEARQFYGLEHLWQDAAKIKWQ